MEKYKVEDSKELEILSNIDILVEDNCTSFAKDLENEISNARAQQKRIEYYSDKIIVYSYKKNLNLGQDILIFELIYRKKQESKVEHSYIANRNMYGSHLLQLINRGELMSK